MDLQEHLNVPIWIQRSPEPANYWESNDSVHSTGSVFAETKRVKVNQM